jgi:hypothetical protein
VVRGRSLSVSVQELGPQETSTPKSLPARRSPHRNQRQSRRCAPCLAQLRESGLARRPTRSSSQIGRVSARPPPARTGRQGQWAQVNPVCPQLPPPLGAGFDPVLDPTKTLTEEKLLSALPDPHSGQSGRFPSEYSDMDMRTSKECPQS